LEQFQQHFHSELVCEEYLFHAKWPNGFCCPLCRNRQAYTTTTRRLPLYECSRCRYQSSATCETIIEGSRTSLTKWFTAIFLVTQPGGTSALNLSRVIQVTYKTAWLIMHKIRHAISTVDGDELLSGIVRVNASFYGRPHNPTIFQHPQEHALLAGCELDEHEAPSFIKLKHIPRSQMKNRSVAPSGISAFVSNHIEPVTTSLKIVTSRYSREAFQPLLAIVKQTGKWINDTFRGLGCKHLQSYLDEYCYRYNKSRLGLPLFFNLVHSCTHTSTITYRTLTRT
jgi:hypothetical protein